MARLPPQFPRTLIHREPDNSHCQCGCALKRIGADVSEKLDCTPGVFTVEWVCDQCETLIQAPVPAQVSDKGIPTVGLLAHIMVAKFADHLPLYHQEKIFGRAGLPIARSTLAQWVGNCGVRLQPLVDVTHDVVHADETQVQMLTPARKNSSRLRLGLCHQAVLRLGGGRLRLQPEPPWRTCPSLLGQFWSAMTLRATRQALNWALRRSAAWPMPAGSSSTCTHPTRARS